MMRAVATGDLGELAYGPAGLVPVVAQDRVTGNVLMLAWADQEALAHALETGWMTYRSRSRDAQWVKGETSGHRQRLRGLYADCDNDAVLAVVDQEGPACHIGNATCWATGAALVPATFLGQLERIIRDRRADAPAGSYTVELLNDPALAADKVEEEAGEVLRVLRGEENPDSLEHEAADLLYHLLVALHGKDVDLEAVLRELAHRHAD